MHKLLQCSINLLGSMNGKISHKVATVMPNTIAQKTVEEILRLQNTMLFVPDESQNPLSLTKITRILHIDIQKSFLFTF